MKRTWLCRKPEKDDFLFFLPHAEWLKLLPRMIKCKSIYAAPHPADGERIYVDRLWPEGLSTRAAAVAKWLQEAAPSYELWRHNYDLNRWEEYRKSYLAELQAPEKKNLVAELRQKAAGENLTLLYGTSDERRNNAEILKEFLACN